ncbi:MAG: PIN domain-containing protein [Candidatus Binatia bacterium]
MRHASCINCDQLVTIDKSALTDFVGAVSVTKMRQLRSALRVALDVGIAAAQGSTTGYLANPASHEEAALDRHRTSRNTARWLDLTIRDHRIVTMSRLPKQMGAGDFKARCLRVLDEVAASKREVVITKRGPATHAWLWWAGDHDKLPARLRRRLGAERQLGVSAMSCWEAAMRIRHGRLELAPDARTGLRDACAIPRLRIVPVTDDIAIEAGLLGSDFHGDPADRIIVATALDLRVPLVTRDERIRSSKLVDVGW